MFVTELIQQAVAGSLRFDFIESTITAVQGGLLSSQKGKAQSEPSDAGFQYHFQPRGMLKDEWVRAGGYLDPEFQATADVKFHISGTERSSATWFGSVDGLRLSRGVEGSVIHGHIDEWSRSDEHCVRMSFMRIIVPGVSFFPARKRNTPGLNFRSATVSIKDIQLEFRDHGSYTEVCVQSVGRLPDGIADPIVAALAEMFDLPLHWVYRELHGDDRRYITVKQVAEQLCTTQLQAPTATPSDYPVFWRSYTQALAARL